MRNLKLYNWQLNRTTLAVGFLSVTDRTRHRWVTTVQAKGRISAYMSAIQASKAVSDHPEVARQWLRLCQL